MSSTSIKGQREKRNNLRAYTDREGFEELGIASLKDVDLGVVNVRVYQVVLETILVTKVLGSI